MKLSRIAAVATAVAAAGALASAPIWAALTEQAAAAVAGAPLYLPASPADPGGLAGYDHSVQLDFVYEASDKGKNKVKKDKIKAKQPKKLKAGPKVKAGTYTLAPAPAAEPN
ncbi:hypothetical protein [Cupriavidus pauculus]|uniref:Uncharacterized protein n=1 Tax=Cupriavidus pauculus TaxID=82633 RepID=A0A2N5C6T4_9BURK|nr:hypothetical protein [Cupriavidus pauculus]PLP97942.1 hypothetical protein CYJ10_24410 [Cupriavidus pauculus]